VTDEPTPASGTAGRRWRADLLPALAVAAGTVLLGAPAGLIWSAVAPRLSITLSANGPTAPDLESTKAFIGADGTYLVVVLLAGALTGAVAWLVARRSGPWTVLALAVGGAVAALVAARVGVVPGARTTIEALQGHQSAGQVDLYLGGPMPSELHGGLPHLRAPWAAVGWPVAALLAFVAPTLWRPDLDA
jgi:hypothetical protein